MRKHPGLRGAIRLFLYQMILAALISFIAAWFSGRIAAASAILGGLVASIPSFVFAQRLFRYQGARAARKIVNSFYKGEALKIILSALLFSLVFMYLNIVPFVFFATYIVVQLSFWFAPLILDIQLNRPKSD